MTKVTLQKLIPAALMTGLLFCSQFARAANDVLIDRVVAVVNDDVVTLHELNQQADEISKQLEKRGTPLPPEAVLKKQVLERIILDRLHSQYAKEIGLRIDDEQLDKALARIAHDNNLGLDQFRQAVEKDGVNFDRFKEEIRGEILRARLKEREVDSKIIVTDSEVDNYLKNQDTQQGLNQEYNLAHILIRIPDEADSATIRAQKARAQQAYAELARGADFGQVAAAYSDAPDALQGGAIGWRKGLRLPTLFLDAVEKMKPGGISQIMQSSNGFHIVKLIDTRGSAAPAMVTQTHVRHILAKQGEMVSEDEAKKRLIDILARIKKGSDFGEEAKLHSDDPSAAAGGDLGWVAPGDTVPEFEAAMNQLKPGEISPLVHTQFGWHLIQVLGRKTEDVARDKQRQEARQAIATRKSDEAYQDWLRQLRDRAYVEYHLDDK